MPVGHGKDFGTLKQIKGTCVRERERRRRRKRRKSRGKKASRDERMGINRTPNSSVILEYGVCIARNQRLD